jgi:polysaccharide biosynthesis transport protein
MSFEKGPTFVTRPWSAGRVEEVQLSDQPGIDLKELLAIVRRRRMLFLGISGTVILLTLLYLFAVKPTYTASAEILLDPTGERMTESGPVSESAPPDGGAAFAESQLRVVQSESVLRRVVATQQLPSDPEFGGERNLPVPPAVAAFLHRIRGDHESQESNELRALRRLGEAVTSKHSGKALVVDVEASSHDPQKSARLANAVADAYLAQDSDARAGAAIGAANALSAHLADLSEQVRQSDEKVQHYKFEHNTIAAPDQLSPLSTKEALVGLRELERKAEVDRTIYQSFLMRARQAAAKGALDRTNARIISQAVAPIRPSWPPVAALLGLASVLGVGLGIGAALARDYFDTRIHTRRQLEAACQLRVLAAIPDLKSTRSMPKIVGKMFSAAPELTVADIQFLRLRDSLPSAEPRGRGTILLITSSGRKHGNSTIAANLALASMHDGERVLLVDADLQNRAISNHLPAKPTSNSRTKSIGRSIGTEHPGFNDIVKGRASFEASLRFAIPERLAILPAGSAEAPPSRIDRVELMDLIFSKALQFDLTIIDCGDAPSNRFVRSLAAVAHQIVLVVKAGATRPADIELAKATLSDGPSGICGVILNSSARHRKTLSAGSSGTAIRHDPVGVATVRSYPRSAEK